LAADSTFEERLERVRLIATDLDGTLVNSHDEISERNVRALRAAMDRGYWVSFLTGRSMHGLDRVSSVIEANAPVVCSNGAQVASGDRAIVFSQRFIGEQTVRDLVAYLLSEGVDFVIRSDAGELISDNPHHPVLRGRRKSGEEDDDPYERTPHVSDPTDSRLGALDVVKVMVMLGGCPTDAVNRVESYCSKDDRLGFTKSADDLLEVAPAGTDKGTGLRKVCEVVGIDRDECLVFGDYDNDVPAFDVAGIGVCMRNGSEAAKAHADLVCPSNDEDGVGEFIERHLLRG